MMVMTHGLNIPERLPHLCLTSEKPDMIHTHHCLSAFCWWHVPSGGQMQLELVSFASIGRSKDAGKGLQLGAGTQR